MACPFMAYTQARASEEMDRTLPKFESFENKYEVGENIKLVHALNFCMHTWYQLGNVRKGCPIF